ncbi:MAG: hypothetical protein AB7F96_11675 [Beijerinckiaceae bacterium]
MIAHTLKARLTNIGLGGLILGIAVLIAATFGLDAARDAMHRGDSFVPAPEVRLVDGRCKSKLFLITACDLTLRDPQSGQRISRSYVFPGPASYTNVSIMRSASDRSYLTTNIGQETFWMRFIMVLSFVSVFLFMAIKVAIARPEPPPSTAEVAP